MQYKVNVYSVVEGEEGIQIESKELYEKVEAIVTCIESKELHEKVEAIETSREQGAMYMRR